MPRLKGKFMVISKRLVNIKHGVDEIIEKYNVRFMARGLSMKEGEYYDNIFSPMA